MSKYAVVTSISQVDLLPDNPSEEYRRQYLALIVEDFDYIEYRGIPEPPAEARMIVGESSEIGNHDRDGSVWKENFEGTGWSLNTRIGAAYYEEDLAAGVYQH